MLKDIKGYEGYYMASDDGRIYSCKSKRYLSTKPKDGKYCQITLCKDGRRKDVLVHRLIAETFIPNPDNLPEVNHINEDKSDNRVENLEWITRRDNANYGTRNKRTSDNLKGNPNLRHTKSVYQLSLDGKVIAKWDSIKEASDAFGIHSSNITHCCKGNQKTAGGYVWRYEDVLEG